MKSPPPPESETTAEESGGEYRYPLPDHCQIITPPTDDAPAPYYATPGNVWDGEGP